MKKVLNFVLVVFLSCNYFLFSCNSGGSSASEPVNDSSTIVNDSLRAEKDSITLDSSAKKQPIVMRSFPSFIFYRTKTTVNATLQYYYNLHAKSIRFRYHLNNTLSVNGLSGDCNNDPACVDDANEVDRDEKYIDNAGQNVNIVLPQQLYSDLVLTYNEIDSIKKLYPNFKKIVLIPTLVTYTATEIVALNGKDQKYFTTNTTYLTYKVSVDNVATGIQLNPHPPGHPPS